MKRRDFLRNCLFTGVAGMALGSDLLAPKLAFATENNPFEATSVDAVFDALNIAVPEASDRIRITAPKVAENGASVPVVIESAIEGTSEIITIVSENPKPLAARNRFTNGAAPFVSSRMKMGQTTEVIALVKAGSRYYSAKTKVKVTVGGCGG